MVKNIEDAVRYILAHYPLARGNDVYLVLRFWTVFDNVNLPSFVFNDIMHNATHFETIRRTRQKIQSKSAYLPSKKVLAGRRKSQGDIREWTKK